MEFDDSSSMSDVAEPQAAPQFPNVAAPNDSSSYDEDFDEYSEDLHKKSAAVAASLNAPPAQPSRAYLLQDEDNSSSEEEHQPTPYESKPKPTQPECQQKTKSLRQSLLLSDDDDDDEEDDDDNDEKELADRRASLGSSVDNRKDVGMTEATNSLIRDILGEDSSDEENVDAAVNAAKPSGEEADPTQPEEDEEKIIAVELPHVKADLGSKVRLVKITNFMSIEPRPFDPATYEDESHEDALVDEQGSTRLKLKVENTIRWRTQKNALGEDQLDPNTGQPLRESNARFVKWSDGTMSLHLGAEIFDINCVDIRTNDNFLYIRQGQGLQGQHMFSQKLSFRPHSTDSFTHKKITMSMANKSQNKQNVKILHVVGEDPEQNKRLMLKREDERLKNQLRRENQQRRIRERQASREISANYHMDHRSGRAGADLEDEEDGRHRARPGSGGRRVSDVFSSDSGSDLSITDIKKKTKKILSDEESVSE